jgi:hypothetical protein
MMKKSEMLAELNTDNNGVNWSEGVNSSRGVRNSRGVNSSEGVNSSRGVNSSEGVSNSRGVNSSEGVNSSRGVNWSRGVNSSEGVNWCYGVFNSNGVDKQIFCADKKRTYNIFMKDVSESRFNEVWSTLHKKLNGWYPKFNNAFELYVKNGSDWAKVKASEITKTLANDDEPYEAWKDMPVESIEYIKSLPEFDADIFKRVTGIDVNNKKQKLLDKAQELIDRAEELMKEIQ